MNNKKIALLAVGMLMVGVVGSVAVQSFAQGRHMGGRMGQGGGMMRQAPLGNDGVVASINGTTITMTEEADEGGGTYTVDASGATFMKDGVASTISGISVGDKIFVHGKIMGNNIVATKISTGNRGRGFERNEDKGIKKANR